MAWNDEIQEPCLFSLIQEQRKIAIMCTEIEAA